MILLCYGTRPEWIKIKPLLKAFEGKIKYKVLYTGQHEDIGKFYHDYKIQIKNKNNRLNSIISSVLDFNLDIKPEYIVVQGDTATTFAMALWAFNKKIKIIHLEAGLRTYDKENPFPEETYRQMISRMSDINFCATSNNLSNLINENNSGKNYVVGNTVLDNLIDIKTSYSNEIIITLHRRENHSIIKDWFEVINNLASINKDLVFTIPLHPNPNIQKYKNILTNLNVISPLEYSDMVDRIANCKFIISDSGGIQEEASFLNKKVIVCRKKTERQESLGSHSILCETPSKLEKTFQIINEEYKIKSPSPYGDGRAAEKILNVLIKKMGIKVEL